MLNRMIVFCALFLVSGVVLSQEKIAVFANENMAWLKVDEGFKTSFDIKLSELQKLEFEDKLSPLQLDVKSEVIKIAKDTYRVNLIFKPETSNTYPIKIFSFLGISTCEVAGQQMSVDETFIK